MTSKLSLSLMKVTCFNIEVYTKRFLNGKVEWWESSNKKKRAREAQKNNTKFFLSFLYAHDVFLE